MSRLRLRPLARLLVPLLLAACSAGATASTPAQTAPSLERLQQRLASLDGPWQGLRSQLASPELLAPRVSDALAAALADLETCRCTAGGRSDAAALGVTLEAAAREAGADPVAIVEWTGALRAELVPLATEVLTPAADSRPTPGGLTRADRQALLQARPAATRAELREGLRELRPEWLRGWDDSRLDGLLARWLRAGSDRPPSDGLLLRLRRAAAPGLPEPPR